MITIKFAILHTSIYNHRRTNLTTTWLKDQDHIFYSDHSDPDNNVIQVSDDTTYHSNEIKFINIFNTLETNTDWIMFIDDDTFINIKLLHKTIKHLDPNKIHGQMINCWQNDQTLYYPSGGAGILIHKNIYNRHKGNLQHHNTGFSDVTFGIHIRQHQIPTQHNPKFNSQPPTQLDQIQNNISYHYIKTIDHQTTLHHQAQLSTEEKPPIN